MRASTINKIILLRSVQVLAWYELKRIMDSCLDKVVAGHFDKDVVRQLKQIALNKDQSLQSLLEEALNDLFEKYNVEIITWPAPVYTYPGVRNGDFDGQLMIYRDCGERIINSKDYLRRQIKNLHYLSDVETPMFYVKGVVSLALINMVKSKSINGRFYNSHTPDGYSGIILANEVDNFLYSLILFSTYSWLYPSLKRK